MEEQKENAGTYAGQDHISSRMFRVKPFEVLWDTSLGSNYMVAGISLGLSALLQSLMLAAGSRLVLSRMAEVLREKIVGAGIYLWGKSSSVVLGHYWGFGKTFGALLISAFIFWGLTVGFIALCVGWPKKVREVLLPVSGAVGTLAIVVTMFDALAFVVGYISVPLSLVIWLGGFAAYAMGVYEMMKSSGIAGRHDVVWLGFLPGLPSIYSWR